MTSGAVTLWLADHPRIRRAVVAMTLSYTLSLLALLCAPQAVASGGSAVLGWTGLRDTEGVPIAITSCRWCRCARPPPTTARRSPRSIRVVDAMDGRSDGTRGRQRYRRVVARHVRRGMFIFVIAAALWFLRFALSTGWLVAIATFGLPLYNAVSAHGQPDDAGRHRGNDLRHRRRLPHAARAARARAGRWSAPRSC